MLRVSKETSTYFQFSMNCIMNAVPYNDILSDMQIFKNHFDCPIDEVDSSLYDIALWELMQQHIYDIGKSAVLGIRSGVMFYPEGSGIGFGHYGTGRRMRGLVSHLTEKEVQKLEGYGGFKYVFLASIPLVNAVGNGSIRFLAIHKFDGFYDDGNFITQVDWQWRPINVPEEPTPDITHQRTLILSECAVRAN